MYVSRRFALVFALVAAMFTCCMVPFARAQQTLGGIGGAVTDPGGSVVPGVTVTAVEQGTKLTRTAQTDARGEYSLADLPIGVYTVTFTRDGFATQKFPDIHVISDRTVTLEPHLALGEVTTAVTVEANPLLNAADTTNGYTLDHSQIESIPQATGSFTGMAVLSPGVNAELPPGTGAQEGLGNLPIWANGQRDTSNTFQLNGVDASSLFNGKSTSSVDSGRVINSTGATGTGAGGVINSSASIYLSIGESLPTPAPQMLEEVQVNASMYGVAQGSTSGAHIDMDTASGTNTFHGQVYGRRGTNWINAAPFFFKNDPGIPDDLRNPELHRYDIGGTLGGPIVKNKLFMFVGFEHTQVSDQSIGDEFLDVPVGLDPTNRSADAIAGIVNAQFASSLPNGSISASQVDPTALALLNSPALPGEPGNFLVPADTSSATMNIMHPYDAFLPGTGRFRADMVVGDVDYDASAKDTVSAKYFYQDDPTLAPYAYSNVPGFTEHLDAGAQAISLNNTYLVKSNLSTQETFGFLRERIYGWNQQPFGPTNFPGGNGTTATINEFGSNYFPGVSIVNVLGQAGDDLNNGGGILSIGPNAEGQSADTGVFQNRFEPSGNASWTLGRHTITFGANFSYTQLNTIDNRTDKGTVATDDFGAFAQGYVTPGDSSTEFYVTSFLQGDASRYYRAKQLGTYVEDKVQFSPQLTVTAGVRYDWDGGLSEKYGRIFNFDPKLYSYNAAGDVIDNSGLIIAGNNANGTPGVSPTTLTGRQWGIAPRIGVAYSPKSMGGKVVFRAGTGFYFDRGELFSYFSPGYAIGTVTGGPFGVNQQLPFVTAQSCPVTTPTSSQSLYSYYIPTCGGNANFAGPPVTPPSDAAGDLANPYGTMQSAPPSNPKASDLSNYLPNEYSILNYNTGAPGVTNNGQPVSLGVYDRANKLPYTINYTFDVQWQPSNTVAIDLGYVGNVGRHQVIPVPFNQPGIAMPSAPIHGEIYSYGYTVSDSNGAPINLPNGQPYEHTYEGGNVDMRVPYIGYAAESIDYLAEGVDAYNALTAHVEKRMSHYVQFGASYTYSHALDEQSGLGLFYNGNNPLNLRDAYASSDFDRTHVINFSYTFKLPDVVHEHNLVSYFTNGWSLVGLTILQSGQPYSVIDYSGAVGSVYYSTSDGITNPIVPLAPGCTAKSAKTGLSGAFGDEALNPVCFTVPLLAAGSYNGGIPSNDPYETGFTTGQRNIFRQAFQKRADASLVKVTKLTDRYSLKYTFDVYNLTNTASFDIPGNEVSQNAYYDAVPTEGTPPTGAGGFYSPPAGLGVVTRTIGSPRQIQMSLGLTF